MLWKWVSAAFGDVLDKAGKNSPTQTPQPERLHQGKYIRGEINTSMVLGALGEKSIHFSVGGCLKHNMASRREKKKREKVRVGPGLKECEAGYMRQTIVESCALDGEGYMQRRGGAGHGRV